MEALDESLSPDQTTTLAKSSAQVIHPESARPRIPDDTVVTWNKDGTPRSYFRENSWDNSANRAKKEDAVFHFRDLTVSGTEDSLTEASTYQAKEIALSLLEHEYKSFSPPHLYKMLLAIRGLSRVASKHGQTLHAGIEDIETLVMAIQARPSENGIKGLHQALKHLHLLGPEKTGMNIPLSQLHPAIVAALESRPASKQHPAIPTRIYSDFISLCEYELGLMERASDDLVMVMRSAYANEPIPSLLSPALLELLDHVGRDPDSLSKHTFAGLVTEIALLCQMVIVTFTGMRKSESDELPYNCLTEYKQDGVLHYMIEGVTRKYNKGRPKRAFWVTSSMGMRAVRLAQKLFGESHRHHGKTDYASSIDGKHLLFCRHGLYRSEYSPNQILETDNPLPNLLERTCPQITKEDIDELRITSPNRAWDEEPEFAAGATWPLTRHQLRRSLALYAQGSGIVTLPSLKRQLQHITDEMALYYGRGSAFAKNILKSDQAHFAKEWQEAQGLSQYLAYYAQVVFSDERLFGGHGNWAQSPSVQRSPVSIYDRKKTLEMFERGELAYKETSVGGCTCTTVCKSSPLHWLPLECLQDDCKNIVVKLPKLQRAIKVQEGRVKDLERSHPDSTDYRMEKETLETLKAAEARYLAKEARQ